MKKMTKNEEKLFNHMTGLQQIVIRHYVEEGCVNKTVAYEAASKELKKVITSNSCRLANQLFNNKRVLSFLEAYNERLNALKLTSAVDVRDKKVQILFQIVDISMDLAEQNREKGKPARMGDAISAIETLNKMQGDLAPTQNEITGKDGGPIESRSWQVELISPKIVGDGK